MTSTFTLNLRKEILRGRKVTHTKKVQTTDTQNRVVGVTSTVENNVDGNLSVLSYEQLRDKNYGDLRPGDAIGRFYPGIVSVGDYITETRAGESNHYRVYLLLNRPKNENGEVVIDRFALKRMDNI